MKLLKKLKRKYSEDFECVRYISDRVAKNCLGDLIKSKNKHRQLSRAGYFEQIKKHQETSAKALHELQKDNKADYQQAEQINKKMDNLRSEYWRLLKQEIQEDRNQK